MTTTSTAGLADALTRLGTETAFDVLARAKELERQGRDVIHLEIGEPDFATPSFISDAAAEALRAGHTHYVQTAGIPELREAAAEYLSSTRGIAVSPDRVLVAEEIAEAARLVSRTGAWVLSDEVYSQMVYDGEFASIATEPGMLERTILLDGLSKTWAMTGWRCGFAAVPDALVDPLVRFFVNCTSCVPPFVQLAGVAALRGPLDEPRAMMEEFRRRREVVVNGLNSLPGVSCRRPRGAFYAFPNVSETPLPAP